jgi:hypothetical protein
MAIGKRARTMFVARFPRVSMLGCHATSRWHRRGRLRQGLAARSSSDALHNASILLVPPPVCQSAVNAAVTTVNNSVNVPPGGSRFPTGGIDARFRGAEHDRQPWSQGGARRIACRPAS